MREEGEVILRVLGGGDGANDAEGGQFGEGGSIECVEGPVGRDVRHPNLA